MNLRVTLCGSTMRWRFPGSAGWDDWAATRPWSGNGGVAVLGVHCQEATSRLAEEVDASVRSVDQGRSRILLQRPRKWAPSALESARQWLDLPAFASTFETKQAIANELAHTPRLFINEAVLPSPEFKSQLEELVATTSKFSAGARFACVLFSIADGSSTSGLTFTEGEPAEACLTRGTTEGEIFTRYLHFRVAWESGGRIELAEELESFLGHPGHLTDDDLEARLNAFAMKADAKLAELCIQKELAIINEPKRRGSRRDRLAPWVARRMLLAKDARIPRPSLRHLLTCMPLAREIAARCFDIESEIRGRYQPRPHASVKSETAWQWSEFGAGRGFARSLYPAGTPAMPESEWSLATLGEFLIAVGAKPVGSEHQVRLLRNALSHGHYASWRAVEALLVVERQL